MKKYLQTLGKTAIIMALALTINSEAFAQDSKNLLDLSLEELMNIEVDIGGRGGERTVFNSPVPIDVITAAEIKNTGLTDLTSVMQRLIPAFNSPRPSITDGTDHIQPFTLRGLSSDQVLVLINGKRKHNSALVHINNSIGRGSTSNDLNTIPVESIERIEILRDGAAAQYGSDAIAGIVNIVLKTKPDNSSNLQYKTTNEGDGNTYTFSHNYGYENSKKDYFNLTAEFRDRDYTNRSIALQDIDAGGLDKDIVGKQIYRQGDAAERDILLVYNYSKDANDATLYSFGYLNNRYGEGAGYYRKPSEARTLVAVYPQGFLPLIKPKIFDGAVTAGVKAKLKGWDADISVNYGKNRIEYNVDNSINSSLGPTSPRSFYCGALQFQQTLLNADFFKAFDFLTKNPLNLGVGFEYRMENFSIEKGEEASYITGTYSDSVGGVLRKYPGGAQVFPGFQPINETDKSKNNFSIYADLENKLLDNLLIGLAGRYENFSDFGKTVNGKFSFRYEPIEKLVVRASTSTGFKAPTLEQSYFTATSTNSVAGVPYQIGTFSVEHPLAKLLGAQPLKPEKSFHISGGIATQLIDNLSISVDYYYTHITDRIVLSGNFLLNNSSDYVVSLLNSYKVGGARFFTNAVDTKTSGLDLVAKYNVDFKNAGLVQLSAGVNYSETKIDGNIKVPAQISDAKTKAIFFDRIEAARMETMQPKLNLQFGVDYKIGDFKTNIKVIKYGDIKVVQDVLKTELDQTYAGKVIVDLNIDYQIFSNFSVNVGGHNILNTYPDKVMTGVANYKIVPYTVFSPFGFNGADYYAGIKVNL